MDILLASNNDHKKMEIRGILRAHDFSVRIWQPKDLGFSFDCVEDGDSFGRNAMIKALGLQALAFGRQLPGVSASDDPAAIARAVSDAFSGHVPPILADDSGLCVSALDGGPGIRTARYGSERTNPPENDRERYELLLEDLKQQSDRTAYYVCNAVLVYSPDQNHQKETRYYQTQDMWHGEITREPQMGTTGFGYDPVFWLSDYQCTVAQLPQEQKDRISHRAKAVAALFRAVPEAISP